MPSHNISIIGAYAVEPTPDLFAEAMDIKYDGIILSADDRRAAERAVLEEISHIVLLEVAVTDPDSLFDVGDFGQSTSDQAPYGEVFLSEDGAAILGDGFTVPSGSRFRVAFFLHFVNPDAPLNTSYGAVPIPALATMPERLAKLVPYEPVC